MGNSEKEKETKNILHSLIIAFTKIEQLRTYFYFNSFKEKINSILSNVIQSNNPNIINDYLSNARFDFQKKNDDIDVEMLICYLLDEINEGMKKDKNAINLIKQLFYCKFQIISGVGKINEKRSENPLIFSIDLSTFDLDKYKVSSGSSDNYENNGNKISLNKIIKEISGGIIRKDNIEYNIISMPEIFIIILSNFNDNLIEYYISQKIEEIPYELIYIILDKNDKNENKNFFKENIFWYEYKIQDNSIQFKNIKDIMEIKENPKILFYKKNNSLIHSFSEIIKLLDSEKQRILDLMKQHIIPEFKYEDYYLIDKNMIDELKKNLNKGSIPKEINFIDVKEKKDNYTNLSFPIDFVLIQVKVFQQFLEISGSTNLKTINYKFNAELNEKKFQIKFGEKFAFIKIEGDNFFKIKNKINNHKNKQEKIEEMIFVCSYNENEEKFTVDIIMNYYKKGNFDADVEKYISNRGGMEFFYRMKKVDIKKFGIQNINENGKKVGELCNLLDMETYLDMNKYKIIDPTKDIIKIKNNNNYQNTSKEGKITTNTISESYLINPILNLVKKDNNDQPNLMENTLINIKNN